MRLRQLLVGLLSALTLSVSTQADDIDIFFSGANTGVSPDAMVMLAIDWRPNFWSVICNGECPEFHEVLGEYLECEDDSCQTIKRYELFRAALELVLTEIAASGVTGMKFGLMFNHDNFSQGGSICHGASPAISCSNGGYILLGFQDIGEESQRELFFSKLGAVPNPQGSFSHKYQGAELYFEFFRYLTQQGIYNAHNGWFDLGTDGAFNVKRPPGRLGRRRTDRPRQQ